MRATRYLQTGYLLHLITILAVLLFFTFADIFMQLLKEGGSVSQMILYGYLSLHLFTLPFFSQLDAYSRFQNYKMAKDKLYQYGFDRRLLRPFVYSRCQRDAISVAVQEMKLDKEWKELKCDLGFRWYHILPHIIVRNPMVLFTRQYWNKTLFVKQYHSKYFLW
jgi:hypothetical protein